MRLRDLFIQKFGTDDPIEICKRLAVSSAKATRRIVKQAAVRLSDLKVGTERTIHLSRWEVRQIWNRYHALHPDGVDRLWTAIFGSLV